MYNSLVLLVKLLNVVLIAAFKMLKKKDAEEYGVNYNLLQLSWRVISVLNRILVFKYVKSILEARVGQIKNDCRE